MSNPFVGEIRIFAGNFAPQGWAICDGSVLPIAQNDVLFSLLGTTYGGDGASTFQLPDLRSRVPIHQGNGFVIGAAGGTESVALTTAQLPAHSHAVNSSSARGASSSPAGALWATDGTGVAAPYRKPADGGTVVTLAAATVGPSPGGQPHENRQPLRALNYIISLFGIYPSQN